MSDDSAHLNTIVAYLILGGFTTWLIYIAWIDLLDEIRNARAAVRFITREIKMAMKR